VLTVMADKRVTHAIHPGPKDYVAWAHSLRQFIMATQSGHR